MKLLAAGAFDHLVPSVVYTAGMNVLGIIIFCIGFGIVVSQLGDDAQIMVVCFALNFDDSRVLIGILFCVGQDYNEIGFLYHGLQSCWYLLFDHGKDPRNS